MLKTIETNTRTFEFTNVGELKAVKHGPVDFLREAELIKEGYTIPCTIGYIEHFDNTIEPTHIFINSGCTETGYCYYEETIEL